MNCALRLQGKTAEVKDKPQLRICYTNAMSSTGKTSWGNVAEWYDELVDGQGSNYQKDLLLPNILRCLGDLQGLHVLDLACGQGFFTRALAGAGAHMAGQDISPELIEKAKRLSQELPQPIAYYVNPADDLSRLPPTAAFDIIMVVLAIQNIANPPDVFRACAKRMALGSRLVLVLNHPAFRIPKASDWGWDEKKKVQYRRIERYSSESMEKILMHPGSRPDIVTYSYHRPLQYFVKQLRRAGFVVTNLEEWVSHRQSDSGPRAMEENRARREIPLFLYLEATRI